MMTSALALILTFAVAFLAVENLLILAGKSRVARGLVFSLAILTGFILPWAIVDGLVWLIVTTRRDA
jgi:hypothetical protein